MIISRTPFRISFFGGGTDYPVWYRDHPGAVLATTINKYCYVTCRYLPPFFDHKWKIVYSLVEQTTSVDQIKHPAVRETFRYLGIEDGIEIHHDADLPARTGLGSSSAFTVGLLNALYALKGVMPGKDRLAREAIQIEHEWIRENVGAQDQTLAAHGGFVRIDFGGGHGIRVSPVTVSPDRLQHLQQHLMLVFTGFARTASEVAAEQLQMTPHKQAELKAMHGLVGSAIDILNSDADISEFGNLLHETWSLKRRLSSRITLPELDSIYEAARDAGAIGGKLLGAGGGGFFLFFARPEDQPRIRQRLKGLLHVPFGFDTSGSQIIFYDPESLYRPANGHSRENGRT
jgi:D-glycero-alpha-D-manno-heptose-7-phosphate kinase